MKTGIRVCEYRGCDQWEREFARGGPYGLPGHGGPKSKSGGLVDLQHSLKTVNLVESDKSDFELRLILAAAISCLVVIGTVPFVVGRLQRVRHISDFKA